MVYLIQLMGRKGSNDVTDKYPANPMKYLLRRSDNILRSILSICCANEFVIKTTMEYARQKGEYYFVEATVNQVNQYGGYTGMKPDDYVNMIKRIAREVDFPLERIIMAGDHLGPFIWQNLPEHEAMSRSERLVYQYVAAGFRKIHLDVSMRLADGNPDVPLDVETVARRTARLAKVAEAAYRDTRGDTAWNYRPAYIIGSEVPVPGGTQTEEEMHVTPPDELRKTLDCFKNVLLEENLSCVWNDVVGVVAQIGVEFSDATVHDYDHMAAIPLSNALKEYEGILFEAHSSDYQKLDQLRQMAQDGTGILKVGPELTFAFREALFALSFMERELMDSHPEIKPSRFIETLETVMLESLPNYWEKYYHGNAAMQAFKRKYSFSDRSRYYLSANPVVSSYTHLLKNMNSINIPLTLISQYMPVQYERIRHGEIENNATALIKDKINCVMDRYYSACKNDQE